MNVIIDRAVWNTSNVDPLAIVTILACCARRHTLVLHPRDRPQIDAWLDTNTGDRGTLRRQLKRVVHETTRTGPQAASTVATITVVTSPTDWSKARLSPDHATRILQRPLKLLVENSRNDRAFLLCLAEPSSRRQLDRALLEGWIEFEMGGGITEIHQRVLELTQRDDPTAMIERARLWVMFDRDAHEQDRGRESEDSRRLREAAAQISTPWPLRAHQLERRSIENYVPLATIHRWWRGRGSAKDAGNRAERVEAFGKQPPRIRNNFNMKWGLLGDLTRERRDELRASGRPPVDDDLDPIFRTIDLSLRQALGRGFEGLANAFSAPGAVQNNDLLDEVSPRERRRLIESILERI